MKAMLVAKLYHKGYLMGFQELGMVQIIDDCKISARTFRRLRKKCTLEVTNNAYIVYTANNNEIYPISLYDYVFINKTEHSLVKAGE